jgi:D-methionine transport system substrate-binding protein
MKKLSKIGLGLALLLGLTACGGSSNEKSSDPQSPSTETSSQETGKDGTRTIKVGLVGEKNEIWEEVAKRYEEGTGNKIELVTFSDYIQPNEALSSGDIDINSYQHKKYLEEYNADRGTDLVDIGDTMLAPLGIYSSKIKDVKELKENDKLAIPNDPSNGARALFLLQAAGLIKVDGEPGESISLDDVTENKLNLELIELDASETPRSLDDVTAAVVNDNYALDAGFKPNEDAIFLEDANSKEVEQYINVIATRKENENDKDILDLVKNYYQTDETAEDYDTYTYGAWIPAWKR